EAFEPTPANIEARVKRSELPCGVKVAVLPKKSRGGLVTMHLNLRYGNEESLVGKATAAGMLPSLMARGTQKHSRQELQDAFDKLGARFTVRGGEGDLSVSLECKRDNLAAALKLVGEVLREPAFPEKEFEVLKRAELEGLRGQMTDPNALAR